MRLQVLLLLLVPAILHAHPQRQLDRKRIEDSVSPVSPRGSHKYSPGKELVLDAAAWTSERTERRQPNTEISSTARRRPANRRSDAHVHEPEPASSVLSPVTQQLISPRRTHHEENTESSRRRSRTRAQVSTTEASRRPEGGRREPSSATESFRRSGSRRRSDSTTEVPRVTTTTEAARETTTRAKEEPEPREEVTSISEESAFATKKESSSHKEETAGTKKKEVARHSETESDSTKESVSFTEESAGTLIKETSSFSEEITSDTKTHVHEPQSPDVTVNARRSNREEARSSRRKEVTRQTSATVEPRRKEPTSRGGRRFESSADSAGSANTREYKRRHVAEVSAAPQLEVSKLGTRQRAASSTTESASRRTSGTHRGGATRVRASARTSEVPTTTQRSRRSHLRPTSHKSAPAPTVKSAISRKSEETFARLQEHDVLERHPDIDEIQDREAKRDGSAKSEDSFITRSSHQVVTVTAYPHNKDQNLPSDVSKRGSARGRVKASDLLNDVTSNTEVRRPNASASFSKIKPRTANLLVAPSPPTNSAENNVEDLHRSKVFVAGGYSRLRTKTSFEGSTINEENSILTTSTPFARVGSRKESKFTSTTPRGKSRDRPHKKEFVAATIDSHRQVPTPSSFFPAPNPTVSHTGRTGFKHHVPTTTTTTTENYPANFPSVATTRSRSSFNRKSTEATTTRDNYPPNFPTVTANSKSHSSYTRKSSADSSVSHNFKTLKDRDSRRRAIDNRLLPTTEVSVVRSQSVPSNVPRFSSRYRTELLRATGHGLRATATPAYVPTVPTVRPTVSTTSSTSEPGFSDSLKKVPVPDFSQSEVRYHWENQL